MPPVVKKTCGPAATASCAEVAFVVPGIVVTRCPAAGEPSENRMTPDKTPVGAENEKTDEGGRVAATNREKSTPSTVVFAATVITRASLTRAVPGKYVGCSTAPAAT